MERRKIYGTIIGITSFVLLVLGITYAYFYWSSDDEDKTNVNLTVTKGLDNLIVYKEGTSILDTANQSLEAGESYTDGISATIEFWKKADVEREIYGQISLEILKMLSISNTTDANIGKSDTIKWAITTFTETDPTEILLEEGTFNGTRQGNKFSLSEDFALNNFKTFYKVYIWLDSSAVDSEYPVTGEILSVEISASASDVMSHYGSQPLKVLTSLGLQDDLKYATPNFNSVSPVVTSYGESVKEKVSVSLNSNITGNKTIGTGYTFNKTNATYTLTGTLTNQSYNTNSINKFTCGSTSTTCSTMYKITDVTVNPATTNYSEGAWSNYSSTLSSKNNKAVSTYYTFDGTYYHLSAGDDGELLTDVSFSTAHEGYYTCNTRTGTNCNNLYLIQTVSGTTVTSSQRKQREVNNNYVNEANIYGNKVATVNEADVGIFAMKDDFGMSYYFRGNPSNNYVKFGKDASGEDMMWRIIRINGDGSIRMILNESIEPVIYDEITGIPQVYDYYNDGTGDNTYVGYMIGEVNVAGYNSYEHTHSNIYDSAAKMVIDSWYRENIVKTGYSNYVSDAIYCNDRSLDTTITPNLGYGTEPTYYAAYNRLVTNKSPILTCPQNNDKFTISSTLGNGKLTYPVGLLTADELAMAGDKMGETNARNFLSKFDRMPSMTPFGFEIFEDVSEETYGIAFMFYRFNGNLARETTQLYPSMFSPVISLRSDALKSGDGSETNPFKIEVE